MSSSRWGEGDSRGRQRGPVRVGDLCLIFWWRMRDRPWTLGKHCYDLYALFKNWTIVEFLRRCRRNETSSIEGKHHDRVLMLLSNLLSTAAISWHLPQYRNGKCEMSVSSFLEVIFLLPVLCRV